MEKTMRTLIDTNILIALEDDKVLETRFSDFHREASKNSDILIHPESIRDIQRDQNEGRKEKILSKLEKYQELEKPPKPDNSFITDFGITEKPNDIVDAALLYAIVKNSVDFLITEDKGIHKKAKQLLIQEKVLYVDLAASLFFNIAFRELPTHSLIQSIPVHNLDINDPFFDSLREDYKGKEFNDWFEKICREGRKCFALMENDRLLALTIYKEEEIADSPEVPTPTLKLSTFKVSETISGSKFGELMLKLAFKYVIKNNLLSAYLTTFPKQKHLKKFLEDFGFHTIDRKNGEEVYMKDMRKPPTIPDGCNPLSYSIDFYPNFIDDSNINNFIIPIQPEYHDRLFPDVKDRQTTMDEFTNPIPEGNTIKKAYICNSPTKQLNLGDIIHIYRSDDRKEITSIGIVEDTLRSSKPSEIMTAVGNRTVYTLDEINEIALKEALVIIFRHIGNYNSPISLSTLQHKCNVKGNIQSIRKIEHEAYLKIKQEGNGCW